jgi:hypothetical protein
MSKRTVVRAAILAIFLGSASGLGAQPSEGMINRNDSGGAQYRMDKSSAGDTMSKSTMSKSKMSKKSRKSDTMSK